VIPASIAVAEVTSHLYRRPSFETRTDIESRVGSAEAGRVLPISRRDGKNQFVHESYTNMP